MATGHSHVPSAPHAAWFPPRLVALLLCDAIAVERASHRTHLLGLFDHLRSAQFPVQRRLSLYCKLVGVQGTIRSPSPQPGRYEFQVAADSTLLGVTFLDATPIPAPTREEAA
jgi:hypothetical protein